MKGRNLSGSFAQKIVIFWRAAGEKIRFYHFPEKIDVFGARSPESDRSFFAPDRAQPTNRPRSGKFFRILCLRRPFSSKKIPATYDSVWTKVGLLVELYTNPPSDLYNSIMLLHNSNSKFEALGPKSTGCTVYHPRGGYGLIHYQERGLAALCTK